LRSPKALSEMLVTKAYDFEKPELIRLILQQFAGDGLLIAEGEKHKVDGRGSESLEVNILTVILLDPT
jgi:hypothetical protein